VNKGHAQTNTFQKDNHHNNGKRKVRYVVLTAMLIKKPYCHMFQRNFLPSASGYG